MSDSSSSTSSPDAPRVGAVIVAGGAGTRMGGGTRKQYLEILGEPMLLWALRPFLEHPGVVETVVVLPPEDAADPPRWLTETGVRVAAGGAERSDSVRNGLERLEGAADVALIHDAARPLVSREVIDRVIRGIAAGGAVAALPVTDTLKRADSSARVLGTVDRSALWQAQTPQGFPLPLILEAHRRARAEGVSGTDDAALCERYGIPVRLVLGAPENLKVTRAGDLAVAEALARRLRGLDP